MTTVNQKAYKVRTVQKTRTLTSGEKYTHKYFIGLYREPVGEWRGTWREMPDPFSDQALRMAKRASEGVELS